MKNTNRDDIFKLPVEEKINIALDLWDNIASETDSLPLTDDLRRELDRRLKACEQDPDGESPWEEVKARLEKRFRGKSPCAGKRKKI